MRITIDTPNYGNVTVRNAMFDIDGTNLEEGIQITGEEIDNIIEIHGYMDVSELTEDEVDDLIEKINKY